MKKLYTIMFLIIFIISCSSSKSKTNESEITINLGSEPKTLDPTLNSLSFGSIYMIHFFEGLTKKDKNDKVVSGMAESWDISEDNCTYTFHIKTNVKWSDGEDVTAYDFEYALKRGVNPKTAAGYSHMLNIIKNASEILTGNMDIDSLGVKAIDNKTLEITLENPAPYFLEYISISSIYFPVRKDIIEKYGDSWTLSPETYIVNGPYKMTERKIDEKIVMEVNENYYDKDEIVAKKINVLILDDSNTALALIKRGDLQFSVLEAPIGEIENLKNENYIVKDECYGIYFLSINSEKSVLTNKKVRKALVLAFDRNYIISNITKLEQKPALAFVPFGIKDYDNKDFRVNGGNYISENIVEAKKLMEEAGYKNGENFPVLEIRTTPGYFTLICEAIQNMYKDNLGIDITIKSENYNETYQAMEQKNYDLARTGWTADFSDPLAMLNYFSKTSSINHTGFKSEEFENILKIAKNTKDAKDRMKILHIAEDIIFEYMPIIPIIYRKDPFMINPNLKGVIFNPLGRYKFNYAYIKK